MIVYEYSNKGCRVENQDYISHGSLPDEGYVCVLTDGMGGYSAGDEAAKQSLTQFVHISKIIIPQQICQTSLMKLLLTQMTN